MGLHIPKSLSSVRPGGGRGYGTHVRNAALRHALDNWLHIAQSTGKRSAYACNNRGYAKIGLTPESTHHVRENFVHALSVMRLEKITKTVIGDCSAHPLYNKALSPKMQWCQCADCQHAFTEGYYSEARCEIIFGKTNEDQKVGGPVEKNRVVSSRMVEKVLPFVSEGTWLDVGFGDGSLLFTAQEYGFKPVGIDLRSENVRALQSLGIDAYCTDLTNLHLQHTCAVVSMADVLEHMPYPKNGLVAANRLLQDNGVLFISLPNTENIVWKLMDENHQNPYWGELEHYHNFSRTRLYSLLTEHGFKPVRYGISERYRVGMEVVSLKAKTLAAV